MLNPGLIAIKAAPGEVPPRIPQPGRFPAWIFSFVPVAMAMAAVLYLFDPARFGFYPTCTFYRTTGWLCPGCGSLRAVHQLLHGHMWQALRLNLLFVVSLPFVAATAILWFMRKLQHQPCLIVIKPAWIWIGGGVILIFTIVRNLPFAHAHGLAP